MLLVGCSADRFCRPPARLLTSTSSHPCAHALPAGCAFVTFSTWAEAEAAMKAIDGQVTMPGSSHSLTVKFADAKPAELAKFDSRGTKRGAWDVGGGGGGKRQFIGGMGRGGGMVSAERARVSVLRGGAAAPRRALERALGAVWRWQG